MEHYWTTPIKLTFKWQVEKRTFNGETLEKKEFNDKKSAEDFLSETNYYINGELKHTSIN